MVLLAIAGSVVTFDVISKEWIRSNIPLGGSLTEQCNVGIVNIENTGSAFGLFTNQAFLLSLVAIVGLVIVLLFFRYMTELGFLSGIGLSLIFAGALGNLIDRLRFGHVTDFIYVRLWSDVFWPAFNVADSAITIGALSVAVITLISLGKKDAIKKGDKSKIT